MARAVTIVDSGGVAVTDVGTLNALATPMTPVDSGGVAVTLVDSGGIPIVLVDEFGELAGEGAGGGGGFTNLTAFTDLFGPTPTGDWSTSFTNDEMGDLLAMFAAGDITHLYRPNVITDMRQGITGTTAVTASGDVVGAIANIGAAGTNGAAPDWTGGVAGLTGIGHMVAPATGQRPVYTEATGVDYLAFDTTDDEIASTTYPASTGWNITAGIRDGAGQMIFMNNGTSSPFIGMSASGQTSSIFVSGGASPTANADGVLVSPTQQGALFTALGGADRVLELLAVSFASFTTSMKINGFNSWRRVSRLHGFMISKASSVYDTDGDLRRVLIARLQDRGQATAPTLTAGFA